jgi:hypothetical protein
MAKSYLRHAVVAKKEQKRLSRQSFGLVGMVGSSPQKWHILFISFCELSDKLEELGIEG